jgi:hypothetical protein
VVARKNARTESPGVISDVDTTAMLMEQHLNRRRPEPYNDRPVDDNSLGMLSGLLVEIDHSPLIDIEIVNSAIWMIRRMCRRHDCTRKVMSDPPCMDRLHWRDVADMRTMLSRCGLPGYVPRDGEDYDLAARPNIAILDEGWTRDLR